MADLTEQLAESMPTNYRLGQESAAADLVRYRWPLEDWAEAETDARWVAEHGPTDDVRAHFLGYADWLAQTIAANRAGTRGPAPDLIIVDERTNP
jgi:hypothetical protein